MNRITYKVIYNHKKKFNKNGEAALHIRITFNRVAYYLPTHLYVQPRFWNEKKGLVFGFPEAPEMNSLLSEMMAKVHRYEMKCRQENNVPSFLNFKLLFATVAKKPDDFILFSENELIRRNDIEKGTVVTQQNTLNVLRSFKNPVFFSDLTFELIQNFEFFLISRGLAPNTRNKYHRHI